MLLLITRNPTTTAVFERKYEVLVVASGKQAIHHMAQDCPTAVVLDALSLKTTGDRISRSLKSAMPNVPLLHLHPGPRETAQSAADVVLFTPISSRRLTNSVGHVINGHDEEVLAVGPFQMNVPRHLLIIDGEETQLTPKQARLLEEFMRNPGTIIDRKTLMEKVWETDYMGDTRTLDVHVRWLRKVIEQKRPRYLTTVRGVGYQLIEPKD